MAVSYQTVLRQIALGAGMLRGESTPGLQTSYEDTTLNQWDLIPDGKYPLSALTDALLDAESALANAIADTGGHPWRSYLLSFTAAITSGDVIPAVDGDSNPIIGILGSVCDGEDTSLVCTEQPIEVIRRWERTSSYWKQQFYYFKIAVDSIIHTRSSVLIQCCIYNRETQQTALEANNDMLLPDSLVPAIVSGALAFLGVENAVMYRGMFDSSVSAIKSGLTSVPSVAMNSPTMAEAIST
jgi:hypothetical protein